MSDATGPAVKKGVRDLRLDFFRGVALWFIFLDHIDDNIVSWLTMRNYGFSDATEVFVFISGYTAIIAYSGIMARSGWLMAAARIVRRVWQLYVAHIVLLVAFIAQIAYFAVTHDKKALIGQMNLLGLLDQPFGTFVDAMLLKFRPVNLDVLPLYIVLLASLPLALPALRRWPWVVLGASLILYIASRVFDWNLPASPGNNVWFFNPFAWQLVFYLGASFASAGRMGERLAAFRRVLLPLALIYLAFSFFVVMSWQFKTLAQLIPDWLGRQIYPIDKTNVDVLRIVHILALAYVVQIFIPIGAAWLRWRLVEPLRRCGEQSLQVFCLGTFLSFSAHLVTEHYGNAIWSQIVVSVAGVLIMVAFSYTAHWYKKSESSPPRTRVAVAGAGDG
ncbi:MAG: OpgC family protein [Reyranellaceae bacterium]